MDARSAARLAAVQTLYAEDMGAAESDLEKKLKQFKSANKGARVNKKIFEAIINSCQENREKIDALITANLAEGWKIERIGGVIRAILRAALAERFASPDSPKPMLISEYVSITADFYDEGEIKFVNALLDKAIRPTDQ